MELKKLLHQRDLALAGAEKANSEADRAIYLDLVTYYALRIEKLRRSPGNAQTEAI